MIDLAQGAGYVRASMSFDTGGDAARASEAQEAIEGIAADYPELDITYTNVAQGKLQARLMATTVNTFIYCFAVITGLIAVANVFNTLANALILRRREFAMLKSIGMGNRAFRHMIAYECASYALRGFIIGFVVAALASFRALPVHDALVHHLRVQPAVAAGGHRGGCGRRGDPRERGLCPAPHQCASVVDALRAE